MLRNLEVVLPHKPHLCSSKHTSCPCGQIAQSLSCLTLKLSSRRQLACPHGQRYISVESEGADFCTEASFLVGTLSVHGDMKLASLWIVMLVFQWQSLGGSWLFLNILTNLLSSEGLLPLLGKVVTHPNNLYCTRLFELRL